MSGALAPAGPVAADQAALWWWMLGLGTAAFALFAVLLWMGLRRGRTGDPTTDPDRGEIEHDDRAHRWWLTGFGVVQPAVLVLIVFALTLVAMRATPRAGDPGALVVEITGHRWWYEVTYPDLGVATANELHLPAGRQVELRLRSADVIHSFWVPEIGGKLDMVPDDETTLVLQADEPGWYLGTCAEFCGISHALMRLPTQVHEPAGFDAWVAEWARPPAPPETAAAVRGREVFEESGCMRCHGVDAAALGASPAEGAVRGPSLDHLAARERLAAGVLPNDREALRAFLRDPAAVKPGTPMPPVDLPEAELDALLDYLGGLR